MSQSTVSPITECIACGSTQLYPVLNLGKQPLANSYKKTHDEKEPKFPLAINVCTECFHTQLTHCVNPDLLFKNYLYVTGTSNTFKKFAKWFANFTLEPVQNFSKTYRVLDIGCNDGTQLDVYRELGHETWGIDPAENLKSISGAKGHNIVCDYYGEKHTPPILDGPPKGSSLGIFDIIICQNAFAHNNNQLQFLTNMKKSLAYNGKIYVTTSQADMILNGEFDTIYHEHLSFYTIKSMVALAKRAGLYLIDAIRTPIHGTSFIFTLSPNIMHARPAHIENLIAMEEKTDMHSLWKYEEYAKHCIENVKRIKSFIRKVQKSGVTLIGFGAAAKGNTFLNYTKIKPEFIIDDTPQKQGLYTPGMSILIEPITILDKYFSDSKKLCFMPLAWNFFDEITYKIKHNRIYKDDVFVRTFPKLEVIGNL
jgi:SAM-dependent methyltransferase